jgi:hypothetical protein
MGRSYEARFQRVSSFFFRAMVKQSLLDGHEKKIEVVWTQESGQYQAVMRRTENEKTTKF